MITKLFIFGKTDNRIKIYNKKIESNLDIKGDLTRIEISKKLDDYEVKKICFYHFDNVFPDLYLNEYLYSFKDYEDKTLLAILYAVQNDFPIDNLTRRYKEKVKNLLFSGGHKINFDCGSAEGVLRKVIYSYFVQPNSRQIFI